MHVSLVSTFYYPRLLGGTEHSLQHLAESLARVGVRVSVISLHAGRKEELYEHNGVECHALPATHLARCLERDRRTSAPIRALWHVLDVFNPASGRLLERELRALKPDLVQTHNLPGWSCSAWTAIGRVGLPHVQVLHDYQLTCPPATRFRNAENCRGTCAGCMPFCALRRRLSARVRHVVANSAFTLQVHRGLGFFRSAQSFDVIHGAVPRRGAGPAPSRSGSRLRIGYLGRLHRSKGLELLIDSFIAAGRPDAVLLVAGGGGHGYESELRQRAAGHAIEFLGKTPGNEFLSSIDVLVVPSLWNEPMGRVVIEAATQGVPVIASSRGGIPELVQVGQTGWLFDPSRPRELSEIIGRIDLKGLQRLSAGCLAWGGRFDPEAISGRWLSLYGRLLGGVGTASRARHPGNLAVGTVATG
jgi:glycosyltransferase involved in cell wall biosynthesis